MVCFILFLYQDSHGVMIGLSAPTASERISLCIWHPIILGPHVLLLEAEVWRQLTPMPRQKCLLPFYWARDMPASHSYDNVGVQRARGINSEIILDSMLSSPFSAENPFLGLVPIN